MILLYKLRHINKAISCYNSKEYYKANKTITMVFHTRTKKTIIIIMINVMVAKVHQTNKASFTVK